MDYIIQCLGDCAPQTPCCFASTLLETPNKLLPWALADKVHKQGIPHSDTYSGIHNVTTLFN